MGLQFLTPGLSDSTDQTTYTFSVNLGAPHAKRTVIVVLGTRTTVSIDTVTIGGVAATRDAWSYGSGIAELAIWRAVVPTGIVADIVVHNGAGTRMNALVYRAYGDVAKVSSDVASTDAAAMSVTVPAGGFAIAGSTVYAATASDCAWAGVSEDATPVGDGIIYTSGAHSVTAGPVSAVADWTVTTGAPYSAIAAYSLVPVAGGPGTVLLEYGFETNEAGVAKDLSGLGHDGAFVGDATWFSPGHDSNGCFYNPGGRVEGSGVFVPRTDLEPASALTMMGWVVQADSGSSYKTLLAKSRPGTSDSYAIYTNFPNANTPAVTITTVDGFFSVQAPSAVLADQAWHHLAGSYDGALLRLVIDGSTVASVAATGALLYANTQLGILGSASWPSYSALAEADDVRFFAIGMNDAQISDWMVTPAISLRSVSGETLSTPLKLFGTQYAAGAALPAVSASVLKSLTRRGYVVPAVIKAQRSFTANGVSYAKGATVAAGTFTGSTLRRLLRRNEYLGP